MRKHFWLIACTFLLISIAIISWKPVRFNRTNTNLVANSPKDLFEKYVNEIYQEADLQASGLDEVVFQKAVTGFFNLKAANMLPEGSNVITVVDFNKPSHEKRMWIVDMLTRQLMINTWVAHGSGSGDDVASNFSDDVDSHQSSLGFYITDDVYFGKHGRSLHLDGLDQGFNTSARAREIVVHAADYVGENIINQKGRLGRSWGCPAVSPEVAGQVIDEIKGKTVLFINGNDNSYTSKYLDEDLSANFMFPDSANTSMATLNNGPVKSKS
jgi:hypothetical protein